MKTFFRTICTIFIILNFSACRPSSELLNDDLGNTDFCDVIPILEKSCLKCHSEDGIAPFQFTNSKIFRQKKKTLLYVLDEGVMPPWKPDPEYTRFKHSYHLDQLEKETLYTWIYNDSKDKSNCEVKPLKGSELITHKSSGISFPLNYGYEIPKNSDHYKCFIMPNPFFKDVYLSAIDLVPGNKNAVHHITAFLGTDLKTYNACQQKSNSKLCDCDNSIDENSKIIANWAKGTQNDDLDSNYAFLLPKKSYLAVQIHYSSGFKGSKDSTDLRFKIHEGKFSHEVFHAFINKFDIVIEPNEIKYDTLIFKLDTTIKLLTIWPHCHNLTKEVLCYAVSPLHDTIPLISIKKWDYLWQS